MTFVYTAFSHSFNRFASTFRPLYKKNPQRLESIHKQFIEELRKTVQVCSNKTLSPCLKISSKCNVYCLCLSVTG